VNRTGLLANDSLRFYIGTNASMKATAAAESKTSLAASQIDATIAPHDSLFVAPQVCLARLDR
jgi:hypothetical protein